MGLSQRPLRCLKALGPDTASARLRVPGALLGLTICALALFCLPVVRASAQVDGCLEAAPEIETTPGSQASDVALDAPVLVRFRDPVLPPVISAELLQVFAASTASGDGGDAGMPVDAMDAMDAPLEGQLQRLSPQVLSFVPAERFAPQTRYRIALRVPGTGRVREVLFETGRRVDAQAPELYFDEDVVELRTGQAAERCGLPDGSFLVDLAVPAAVDDADNGALDYYLYLTRAKGLEGPRLLDRARRAGSAAGVVFRFWLSAEEVDEPVCTALRVVDGVGKAAEAEPELCFDPRQGTYFQPLCGVARPGGRGGVSALGMLVGFLVTWALIRGRHRRIGV